MYVASITEWKTDENFTVFLHAVACQALAPVSNSQAHCLSHACFIPLVDAILIAVVHSRRF